MATDERSEQEQAVRDYLNLQQDPASLVDTGKIAAIIDKLDASTDALERMQLRSELRAEQQPPTGKVEEAFILHARGWASGLDVTAEDFLAEGVEPHILRKAGFSVPRGQGGRNGARSQANSGRNRITTDDVVAHVNAVAHTEFTVPGLADATGAHHTTARRAISLLVEEGVLREAGVAETSGGGRRPRLYERT